MSESGRFTPHLGSLIKPSLTLPARHTRLWFPPHRRSCRGISGICRGSWLGLDQEPAVAIHQHISPHQGTGTEQAALWQGSRNALFSTENRGAKIPTRSLPVKDWPPACSIRNDMGKTSYRTLQNQTNRDRFKSVMQLEPGGNAVTDAKWE